MEMMKRCLISGLRPSPAEPGDARRSSQGWLFPFFINGMLAILAISGLFFRENSDVSHFHEILQNH